MFDYNLLLEQVANLTNRIIKAMYDRKVIKIDYQPVDDPKGGLNGIRDIEIYALGVNRFGNMVIYAWLRNDKSKTLKSGRQNDALRWRMFRLDGIKSFTPTIQTFDISDDYVKNMRPKLNKTYNRSLTRLLHDVFSVRGVKNNNKQKPIDNRSIYDKANTSYTLEENKNF
jgi:hypothetical protein